MARLAQVGEERVVEEASRLLAGNWECPHLGLGDDAVCAGRELSSVLFKIDGYSMASARLPWNSLADVAWKAVTATASDLAAKAAKPIVFLLSVGLDPGRSVEEFREIVEGARDSALAHGAWLGGGDTNSANSRECEWIDVAGLGEARRPLPLACRAPGTGRLLVYTTTGRIGLTGIAYHFLSAPGSSNASWIETSEWRRVLMETSRPLARIGFPSLVERLPEECVLCSSDVSDGLAYTLYRLAEASGLEIIVEELPVEKEAIAFSEQYGVSLEELAFYSGEEYEVVFAVNPECSTDVEEEARRAGLAVGELGWARRGESRVVYGGRLVEKKRWDQFRGWS